MIGILRYLAVSPVLLTGLLMATIPSTEAASLTHSPRSHHAGIARRFAHADKPRAEFEVVRSDAQSKRRVKKRGPTGGKTCRIRQAGGLSVGASSSSSAAAASATGVVSSSASASATDSAAAQAASASSSVWTEAAVDSSSTAAPESTAWTSTWVAYETEAAASSAPAPAATSAASSGGSAGTGGWMNSGSKVGLCWPNGDWASPGAPDYVGNFIGSTVSFMYDWHYQGCKKASDLGIEYVPMMWGSKDAVPAFYEAQANWPSTTKHVLFFNEPNDPGQSNISPEDAVQYWKNYMSPLKAKGYLIGMAATTSAPTGLQWVLKFKDICPECWAETDFVPLHYYDVSTEHFKSYVTNYHDQVQKPIWVTEYACQNFNGGAQCSWDETMSFHYEMAAWFNEQSWVERYSPFGAMKNMQGVEEANRLMDAGGGITALGSWYVHSA